MGDPAAVPIVAALDRLGAEVEIVGEALRVRLAGGTMPPVLAESIRAHKPALVAALVARRDAAALDRLDATLGGDGAEPEPPTFAPLDASICRSTAMSQPNAKIVARLSRLEATGAAPDASPLDRQLVADWRAILAVRKAVDGATGRQEGHNAA